MVIILTVGSIGRKDIERGKMKRGIQHETPMIRYTTELIGIFNTSAPTAKGIVSEATYAIDKRNKPMDLKPRSMSSFRLLSFLL